MGHDRVRRDGSKPRQNRHPWEASCYLHRKAMHPRVPRGRSSDGTAHGAARRQQNGGAGSGWMEVEIARLGVEEPGGGGGEGGEVAWVEGQEVPEEGGGGWPCFRAWLY